MCIGKTGKTEYVTKNDVTRQHPQKFFEEHIKALPATHQQEVEIQKSQYLVKNARE
jgi:hypothetical protein